MVRLTLTLALTLIGTKKGENGVEGTVVRRHSACVCSMTFWGVGVAQQGVWGHNSLSTPLVTLSLALTLTCEAADRPVAAAWATASTRLSWVSCPL